MSASSRSSMNTLRQRAEQAIRDGLITGQPTFGEIRDYLQELHIYQVELEMQAEELRRAQLELEASRDELAELYENAPVGYLSLNYSGVILRVNRTFQQMVGLGSDRLIHKPLSKFIRSEDHRLFFTVCRKAADSEKFRSCELEFEPGDGHRFYGRLDITPEWLTQGHEPQYRVAVVDITEKKLVEDERLRLEKEVLKAQKEDSLKRLAGGIAHNFNNLLTVIMGNVELVLDSLPPRHAHAAQLRNGYGAAERAAELSKMMLSYLGYPLSRKTSLDLAETVGSLVKVIRSTVHGHISVFFDEGPASARVLGDPVQIAQLLNNLVENSIAAIGDNQGCITIKIYQKSFHGRNMPISAQGEKMRAGTYGCIEVADDGCGMKPDILDKVIDPFFTTHFIGRGLGLSAAWGIARAHDGYLFIESEPGRGTTVRMYLPLISPDQVQSLQPLPPLQQQGKDPLAGTKRVVLYVDDDQIVRMIGRKMLEQEGYQVLEAGGGSEAVAMLQECGGDLLCVVLDYAMPDMDGNLALIEMRKIRPDLPVLLVSGFLQEQAVAQFLTEKPNGFLQKPFHRDEFIASVARVLAISQRPAAKAGRGRLS